MFVVGEKEMTEMAISVRRQGRGDLGIKPLEEMVEGIHTEILGRKAD
jgi:threonyl-tRNA synthetase